MFLAILRIYSFLKQLIPTYVNHVSSRSSLPITSEIHKISCRFKLFLELPNIIRNNVWNAKYYMEGSSIFGTFIPISFTTIKQIFGWLRSSIWIPIEMFKTSEIVGETNENIPVNSPEILAKSALFPKQRATKPANRSSLLSRRRRIVSSVKLIACPFLELLCIISSVYRVQRYALPHGQTPCETISQRTTRESLRCVIRRAILNHASITIDC